MRQLIVFYILLLCPFGFCGVPKMLTKKQMDERIQLIKKQGRRNKWHVIMAVTPPGKERDEVITVEKLRSGEFIVTWYVPDKFDIENPKSRYDMTVDRITSSDRRYGLISKIEQAEMKLNSWSGGIILGGFTYSLEIDAIDTKTVMILTDKSFEGGFLPLKQWIDFLRSPASHVR